MTKGKKGGIFLPSPLKGQIWGERGKHPKAVFFHIPHGEMGISREKTPIFNEAPSLSQELSISEEEAPYPIWISERIGIKEGKGGGD